MNRIEELIERRAIALLRHEQELILAEENKRPPELRIKLHVDRWNKLAEEDREYWRGKARIVLNDPDLALIDRRNYNAFNKAEVPKGAELAMVIPLAEALKELKE